METPTKLSARSLAYYIDVCMWKNELDFFNIEVHFLNRLMEEHFLQLAGEDRIRKLTHLGSKLSALMNEKHQIKELIDLQITDLELMADDLLDKLPEEMVGRQAHLEYQMKNLIHNYREVKTEFYAIAEAVLNERKLLIN